MSHALKYHQELAIFKNSEMLFYQLNFDEFKTISKYLTVGFEFNDF